MTQNKAKVSIVIPFTRPHFALPLIKNIFNQNRDTAPEIILVGAGSSLLIKEFKEKIRTIDHTYFPGKARNEGAKIAKGKFLIFLDDDCIPGKNWLKNNIETLSDKSIGAVGGKIIGKSNNYFAKSLDFSNFTFAQGNRKRKGLICSATFGIEKQLFEKAQGFDEKILIGEDSDLCMRLRKMGYNSIYDPKIEVSHDHGRQSLGALFAYQFNNGKIKGLSTENKYPDGSWFKFLKLISTPVLYWIFILPFAILASLISVLANIEDNPKVIFYMPGIFIGKLACQCGIFGWTLKKPLNFA